MANKFEFEFELFYFYTQSVLCHYVGYHQLRRRHYRHKTVSHTHMHIHMYFNFVLSFICADFMSNKGYYIRTVNSKVSGLGTKTKHPKCVDYSFGRILQKRGYLKYTTLMVRVYISKMVSYNVRYS